MKKFLLDTLAYVLCGNIAVAATVLVGVMCYSFCTDPALAPIREVLAIFAALFGSVAAFAWGAQRIYSQRT